MAGFWPLYSNFTNKAQVTLALPGKPSPISNSVGGNSPALLLVPNVDFLVAFVKGNIGIADSMSNASMLKNLNGSIASNDEMVARHFSKTNKLGLEGKLDSFKDPKGKIKIPKSDIKISSENDSLGFKAMEKTILLSIFETQKPYMEIAKMVIDVLVSAEDIVARIMPLLSASPLTFKSDKPVGNGGEGKRPKAIGYQGGKEIKEALAALEKMTKIGGKLAIDKNGAPKRDLSKAAVTPQEEASDLSISQNEKLKEMSKSYKIIDAKYSTGNYDPTVEYLYTYLDLPADEGIEGKQAAPDVEQEDPYEKYKPKRIILGIFDSNGSPLNPKSKLRTIDENGSISYTNFNVAEWVLKSPKWVFPKSDTPDITVWPTFGNPTYRWERNGGIQQAESQGAPKGDDDWEVKRYRKGQKNEINGFDAIEGDPIIVGFEQNDISAYSSYFAEYAGVNMRVTDLEQAEKDEATKTILAGLNIKSHLENITLYSQSRSAVYKDFNIPSTMRLPFKPMQITVEEAKSDPNLAGLNGRIWIDPESDYETKIIAVKPSTKIAYGEIKGKPETSAEIKSFIKNRTIVKFKNNEKFNIEILKNGNRFESLRDVDQYILENWNYEERRVLNSNSYSMDIWSNDPTGNILYDLNSGMVKMGRNTKYTMHGDYQISIEKNEGGYIYGESSYLNKTGTASYARYFSGGIKKLGDGTIVLVENNRIVKWYFLYRYELDGRNLPSFGSESTMTFDLDRRTESAQLVQGIGAGYSEPSLLLSSASITLYQMKVSNDKFPYGIIIDSSKISNEHLSRDTPFSTGRYGIGSPDDPQELGLAYRYALTDLDEETYYIIEGIKTDENTQIDNSGGDRTGASKNGKATPGQGGGAYRLPHAIGAITVFIKMLVKIFSKIIPAITKLLKLFKNPLGFVTDTIMEKLGESFSIFAPDSIAKFDGAKELVKMKKQFTKPAPRAIPGQPAPVVPKMGDYVNLVKKHFENSKLKNHVAVDSLGNFKDASGKVPKSPPKDSIGNFKFLTDGVGFIPFTIFGKDLSFGMELKMGNVITKEWGNKLPMRLVFKKEKDSKDPNSLKAKGPSMDDSDVEKNKLGAQAGAESNSKNNSGLRQGKNGSLDPNKRYVTLSTWYSTGEFVKGVDYKYIYIDQEDEDLFAEVDRLSDSIDPSDLQEAKRKLEDARAKNPDDEAVKEKLSEIKKKIFDLNSNTQPLLKMILGIVTLPIKVIAGIVQWMMDFFKSLTNPMALPGKIIEFISFKWIMDFFSPKGLLKLAGIEFDPTLIPQWIAMSKQTKASAASGASAAKAAGATAAKDISPSDAKASASEKIPKLPNDVPKHGGSYALPDDFELVDLTKFLNVSFLAQLPTYTARDIREQPKFPMKLFVPIMCFIEKLINGFIDFVWSLLGIECIIPPPHIKLCKGDDADSMDAEELMRILNGETPGAPASMPSDFKADIFATKPDYSEQSPPLERYVYDVKLPNGETVRLADKESLDKFIEDNRETGFDLQF